jgi:hypothetical protein
MSEETKQSTLDNLPFQDLGTPEPPVFTGNTIPDAPIPIPEDAKPRKKRRSKAQIQAEAIQLSASGPAESRQSVLLDMTAPMQGVSGAQSTERKDVEELRTRLAKQITYTEASIFEAFTEKKMSDEEKEMFEIGWKGVFDLVIKDTNIGGWMAILMLLLAHVSFIGMHMGDIKEAMEKRKKRKLKALTSEEVGDAGGAGQVAAPIQTPAFSSGDVNVSPEYGGLIG